MSSRPRLFFFTQSSPSLRLVFSGRPGLVCTLFLYRVTLPYLTLSFSTLANKGKSNGVVIVLLPPRLASHASLSHTSVPQSTSSLPLHPSLWSTSSLSPTPHSLIHVRPLHIHSISIPHQNLPKTSAGAGTCGAARGAPILALLRQSEGKT